MQKTRLRIGIAGIFSVLLFGCSQDRTIFSFLEKLESNIENELIIEAIKHSNKDSLRFILPVFRVEYYKLIERHDIENEINNIIKSSLNKSFFASNEEILLFAFHGHLNQRKMDLEQIQNEIQQIRRALKEKMKRDEALYEKEAINLIKLNNSKWNVGDTLSVTLEVGRDNGKHLIYYKSYPASLDYSDAKDTLMLKGVLVDKFQKSVNLTDLYFKLKILELNRANVLHGANKLELGSDFDLNLEAYGRPIE